MPASSDRTATIYALSSGPPPAAIAIIRVSGPGAADALATIAGTGIIPRFAALRSLRRPNGDLIDRALVLFFPQPASATGEDVAEFHVHGGAAVIRAMLAALDELGLRKAEAGEFTRRAVLNGRLSLGAAEGLADLLEAETEARRREALLRATGALTRRLDSWTAAVVSLCAIAEAAIDHDEDDDDLSALSLIRDGARGLLADIEADLARPSAERLRDGIRVAIVGPPNSGKSSLFNAIVRDDAAIVSPTAGTTRDVIERTISLGGLPFVLADTAGIRVAADEIEQIGIGRAKRALDAADLVIDLSDKPARRPNLIHVAAKADIAGRRDASSALAVSSRTGEGLTELIDHLCAGARRLLPPEGEAAMVERQRIAATEAAACLRDLGDDEALVVAAEHLRRCRHALDAASGHGALEDVFDALFSRFCVGK